MVSAFELRIALIILAAVIIAAIYIWYRANSKDRRVEEITVNDLDLTKELEGIPTLTDTDDGLGLPDDLRSEFHEVSSELRQETITRRESAQKQKHVATPVKETSVAKAVKNKNQKEMLVVFHIVAREGEEFSGPMIERMMADLQLEYGDMGVYHYNVLRLDKKLSVYFITNMLKPGTFDLSAMNSFKTRGLTMILQLPGPENELKSFNIMVEHAQRLAAFLNGDLLDENHQPVNKQTISQFKEQIQLFGLRASRHSANA